MDFFALGTAIIAAVALGIAATATAGAAVFRARMLIPREVPDVPVTLVLAATGPLPGLEMLFDALLGQTLRPARLIVAVESRDDPAHDRVEALAQGYPALPIELIVAGLSGERAQKCTNLLAALARLRPADSYIVLIDADIRPQPWWLAALVAPLAAGRADIVNGYRWPVPIILSPGAALVAGIDRAIAILPRLSQTRTIWGGSLAVTRRALEILDLPNTIGRTLTEDLPIGDRVAETGLRVLTRRAVRPITPFSGSFHDLWRFGRRQYQLIRLYRPGLWFFAAFVVSSDLIARAVLLSFLATRGPALAAILALACLGSIATEIRLAIGEKLGEADRIGFRISQHILAWTILPTPGFHASVVWGGVVTSPVVWAHIRYIVNRTGQVIEVARRPHSDQSI